jgi:GntR family transcriptional regulator
MDPYPDGPPVVLATLGNVPGVIDGRLPLWYQVTQSLRASILLREPDRSLRLPTEVSLSRHYGVSLATMRQALASLEREGLITRHRRRGTYINPQAVPSRSLRVLGSADAVLAQQASEEVRLTGRSRVPVPAAVAAFFPGAAEVELFQRLRLDQGSPTSYAENFLPVEVGARISDDDLLHAPMTKVLRDTLGIPLSRIQNDVEAQAAPVELARLLEIELLSPVLFSRNVTYRGDEQVVDVAHIHYRGDRFRFSVTVDIP